MIIDDVIEMYKGEEYTYSMTMWVVKSHGRFVIQFNYDIGVTNTIGNG